MKPIPELRCSHCARRVTRGLEVYCGLNDRWLDHLEKACKRFKARVRPLEREVRMVSGYVHPNSMLAHVERLNRKLQILARGEG